MARKRILIMAIVLIFVGAGGIYSLSRLGTPLMNTGGMMRMMMGGGMMDRNNMKEMMQEMMGGILPAGIEPKELPDPKSHGAELMTTYCAQCHNLPSPRMHSAEDWPRVAGRMLVREKMMAGMYGMMMSVKAPTSQEEEVLLQYLKTYAMQALAPGTVPDPGSPAAILFQQTCSQCHALPDPKQHTASEWPAVVDRMQGNMQTMGKRVISEGEKKEIAAYLTQHVR